MTQRKLFVTYNTHLFGGTLAGLSDLLHLLDPKEFNLVEHQDPSRRDALVERIAEDEPDVIGLSEVWANRWKREIVSKLKDRGYQGVLHECWPPPWRDLLPDNGLLLLCKDSIRVEGQEFTEYEPFQDNPFEGLGKAATAAEILGRLKKHGIKWAKLARKGVLRVDLSIEGSPCHVFLTHTPGRKGMKRVKEIVEGIDHKTCPVLIFGDLNVHGDEPAWHKWIRIPFESIGFKDAYRTIHGDNGPPGFTTGPENELVKVFWPKGVDPMRIDYFLVNGKVDLGESSADVVKWTYKGKDHRKRPSDAVDLSDHYGLEAMFASL